MDQEELIKQLSADSKFKEIWLESDSGASLCALINDEVGWLMYQQSPNDCGFSSRNPEVISNDEIEFELSNGQRDLYPLNWTYPVSILQSAMLSFLDSGSRPNQVLWHDDSTADIT